MPDTTESPPRRRRGRWLVRLLVLLLLAVAAVLALDATDRLPPGIKRACEEAGLCGHAIVQDILPGAPRATRLEFPVGASRRPARRRVPSWRPNARATTGS
jgi:hypothetical protein